MKKSKQSQKSGQNFSWSFVIVCFLLAGAVLLNMVSSRDKEFTHKNIIGLDNQEEKSVIIQGNKYIYNSIELSYALENQKNVVYITENGVKKVLLDNVIYDVSGGGEPKFYKTDKPNIALLESGLGDMGSIKKEYYYVDLLSERILKVKNSSSAMSVNGVKISLGLDDNCGTGADRVAGKAYLNKLFVDGSAKYNFNPEIQLTCVNPDGLGSIYEPDPIFNFKGADLDLGKVYFSVLQNSLSFNISDKSITSENTNKITVDRTGLRYLGYGYYTDEKNIYYISLEWDPNATRKLNPKDMADFNFFDEKNRYLFIENPPSELEGVDLNSFVTLNTFCGMGHCEGVAKDKNFIYVGPVPDNTLDGRLNKADVKTFQYLKYNFYKDKNALYYYGMGWGRADYVDLATFELIDAMYSKDKNNVYQFMDGFNIVKGANPKTFVVPKY